MEKSIIRIGAAVRRLGGRVRIHTTAAITAAWPQVNSLSLESGPPGATLFAMARLTVIRLRMMHVMIVMSRHDNTDVDDEETAVTHN